MLTRAYLRVVKREGGNSVDFASITNLSRYSARIMFAGDNLVVRKPSRRCVSCLKVTSSESQRETCEVKDQVKK